MLTCMVLSYLMLNLTALPGQIQFVRMVQTQMTMEIPVLTIFERI